MSLNASNITTQASYTHLATVFYARNALDAIREKQSYPRLVDEGAVQDMPQGNGKTIQFFRDTNMSAPATPTATTEGARGTGLQVGTSNLSATVSQYADWGSVSDLLVDTSISNEVANLADQLGYRAATVVNHIIQNEVDSAAASIDLTPLDTNATSRDAFYVSQLMEGLNIRPLRDGVFEALMHPYVAFDLLTDPQAGGFQDMSKHDASSRGNERLFAKEDRGFIAQIGGVRYWSATDVTVDTAASPDTHRCYISGKGGLGAINLAGRGPTKTMDHVTSPFRVNVFSPGPSAMDPAGKTRTFVAYNFIMVAKLLDTTNYRLRKFDYESSIITS